MLNLETTSEGVILSVKAKAAARKNGVMGVHDGALKIAVTQAPERGKANRAILDLLARSLGLRKSQIELLSGETSPEKRILIRAINQEDLIRRIEAAG
ncbi:MAG: DUF167 domain-containing protein [Planctomycetes bacterium]|nr:DUF167 domain-containing protein [Planctomycetota bacterium]